MTDLTRRALTAYFIAGRPLPDPAPGATEAAARSRAEGVVEEIERARREERREG